MTEALSNTIILSTDFFVLAISRDKLMKRKTHWALSISVIPAISVLLNAESFAQIPRDGSQCLGLVGQIADVVIEGCTAVIQSGQDTPQRLATAFDNRSPKGGRASTIAPRRITN